MKKPCLTCRISKQTKHTVPLWSNKEGIDSNLPPFIKDYDINNLKKQTPRIDGIKATMSATIKQKNTWIFYWAPSNGKTLKMKTKDEAYKNNENHGITKSNSKGNIVFVLNCPQPYEIKNVSYPRHVHFTTLTSNNTWNENTYTLQVYCMLDYTEMKEIVDNKSRFIINAIDSDKNIPNSFKLTPDKLEGNQSKCTKVISEFIQEHIEHYPDINNAINNKTLKLKNIPIVVYCAHEDCDASEKLLNKLIKCGFVNVIDYPGGIEEWFNDSNEINSEKSDDETIEFEGVIYEMCDNKIIGDDYRIIGDWDGEKITFKKLNDKKKHDKLKNKLNDADNDDEDAVDEDAADNDEEDAGDNDEEDVDADNDEEDVAADNDEEDAGDNDEEDAGDNDEEDVAADNVEGDEIKGGGILKSNHDGIKMKDKTKLTNKKYNKQFQGWGFTFF